MSATVSVEDVELSYGEVSALSRISVAFEPGFNVVLGPNGAGKTTLFRIAAGVLPPDDGGVRIEGSNPFHNQSVKSRIGYLPHGTPLNKQLTVRENLDYWGQVLGLAPFEREDRIAAVSTTMQLKELLDRMGSDLSRGQRQRVTIARLLIGDPSVLFLDEPTTGLDPGAARTLREELDELAAEGRTLCYSTHNLYEAELLADELTVIKEGEVVAKGKKDELLSQIRGEGTREIRIETNANSETFDSIGVEARRGTDGWIVTATEDQSVSELISELVERGCRIERVEELETSLEELYDRLTEDER